MQKLGPCRRPHPPPCSPYMPPALQAPTHCTQLPPHRALRKGRWPHRDHAGSGARGSDHSARAAALLTWRSVPVPGAIRGSPRSPRRDSQKPRAAPLVPLRGQQRLEARRVLRVGSLQSEEPGPRAAALPPPPLPRASCCHSEPRLPPPGGRLGKRAPQHPDTPKGSLAFFSQPPGWTLGYQKKQYPIPPPRE